MAAPGAVFICGDDGSGPRAPAGAIRIGHAGAIHESGRERPAGAATRSIAMFPLCTE
jgi:hypothetical protein